MEDWTVFNTMCNKNLTQPRTRLHVNNIIWIGGYSLLAVLNKSIVEEQNIELFFINGCSEQVHPCGGTGSFGCDVQQNQNSTADGLHVRLSARA